MKLLMCFNPSSKPSFLLMGSEFGSLFQGPRLTPVFSAGFGHPCTHELCRIFRACISHTLPAGFLCLSLQHCRCCCCCPLPGWPCCSQLSLEPLSAPAQVFSALGQAGLCHHVPCCPPACLHLWLAGCVPGTERSLLAEHL